MGIPVIVSDAQISRDTTLIIHKMIGDDVSN